MNNAYFIAEIKSRVKMPELLRHYGFRLNKNRMPCCFHNGRDNNLGVKDNYYHCFVCGAKGDIFKFVQDYFGLGFNDSLKKVNEDFGLGFPIGEKLDPKRQIDIARKCAEREEEARAEEALRKTLDENYWAAFDEWDRLNKNMRVYAPKSVNDELHPLFVEATQKISYAEYKLDIAELGRWIYKNERESA